MVERGGVINPPRPHPRRIGIHEAPDPRINSIRRDLAALKLVTHGLRGECGHVPAHRLLLTKTEYGVRDTLIVGEVRDAEDKWILPGRYAGHKRPDRVLLDKLGIAGDDSAGGH